jgi:hypothetical protein
MVTVGKWIIRKQQDLDVIGYGYWYATSPWYLDKSHYRKDSEAFKTWQEAIDHINQKVAATW